MSLQIKRADMTDVIALHGLCLEFNGDFTTEELIADSLLNNRQEMVLVAYEDEFPVGFLCGQIRRSMCYEALHGEVAELYIREEYRRRGIAKKLVELIEFEFKKHDVFIIDIVTSLDNHTAQAFYSSCGYTRKTRLIYRKKIR